MSRLPIVTTDRLKTALRNATSIRGNAGGFESAGSETFEDVPTPEEVRQLQEIADQLATQVDDDVFATRPDQMTSLLQTYLAEHEPIAEHPLNAGGFESTFDTHDVGWTRSALEWIKLKLKRKQPWVNPPEVAWEIPNNVRIAVLGDWGTGLYGAPECADSIDRDPAGFDIHLHLGDVYYSGTKKEVEQRFLGFWPQNARIGHLTTNSNHEMYCGGEGLFQATLPRFREWSKDIHFKQQSTCFAIQNDHLLLVGLDTGYVDHELSNGQSEWLQRMAKRAGERRVVLFSHHQPFSLFERQGPKLVEHLGSLLTNGEVHAWYWGHEHRLVIYDRHPEWKLYGRCVGHSGMPYFRDKICGAQPEVTALYPVAGRQKDGITTPSGRVLDGPNPYLGDQRTKYGPNGYLVLELDGPTIRESYRLPNGIQIGIPHVLSKSVNDESHAKLEERG